MTKDWKETLNLPQTEFPMRANLPEREPEILEHWQKTDPYSDWQSTERERAYVLHDGPPYANGDIHIGHALNKTLKDIVIKYQALRGNRVPYIPGWDCHGLPIETQVAKKLGKKIRDMTDAEFRRECRQYADKFVDAQKHGFKRLGILGDWDNHYLTMDFSYEAETLRRLADLVDRGYVQRRHKPVHWCLTCRTALAEAEVEYADHVSPSIYVRFPIPRDEAAGLGVDRDDVSLLIWTTTPWTLPANQAVAFKADAEYVVVDAPGGPLVLAADRAKLLAEDLNLGNELGRFPGSKLDGLHPVRPYAETPGISAAAGFVELDTGTGLVHIAPGHGQDDYALGLQLGLPVETPVDNAGRFVDTPIAPGEKVWAANPIIVADLENRGRMVYHSELHHSYPHCWRCKKPIIFRATDQWFITMSHDNLRQSALQSIQQTRWTPDYGENRITAMVENRPDWCISRQRRWGVPIAVAYCTSCNTPALDGDIMRAVADRFEEKGADAWFEDPIDSFLPDGFSCGDCGGTDFHRETDILDVWFDSGISWAAVCDRDPQLQTPVDLYLEGSDQHRGWFQSSLLLGVALTGSAPFKGVLTHGFVVDGDGRKMSKTGGNVIGPQEIIRDYGAEILRLWVSSEHYEDDNRISQEILKRVIDTYRRVRNTFRFMLGNIHDFDPAADWVPLDAMEPVDVWMVHRLNDLRRELIRHYDDHQYHAIYQRIAHFFSVDLSALYMDVAKDRLYTAAPNSKKRRSAQTVLYDLAENLCLLLAPILSFTAEEVWGHLPGERPDSVFKGRIAAPPALALGESTRRDWEWLIQARGEVLGLLEKARTDKQIGHSLDARVRLAGNGPIVELLQANRDFLPEWFIVSQVELCDWGADGLSATGWELLQAQVVEPKGKKCDRCWQIHPEVGAREGSDEICHRCTDTLTELG